MATGQTNCASSWSIVSGVSAAAKLDAASIIAKNRPERMRDPKAAGGNDPARDQRRAGSLVRCSAAPVLLHDDRRADLDPVIEIDHVLIGQANAAR